MSLESEMQMIQTMACGCLNRKKVILNHVTAMIEATEREVTRLVAIRRERILTLYWSYQRMEKKVFFF